MAFLRGEYLKMSHRIWRSPYLVREDKEKKPYLAQILNHELCFSVLQITSTLFHTKTQTRPKNTMTKIKIERTLL